MSSICALPTSRVAVFARSEEAARMGCRVTPLAQVVHAVPPLPRSVGGKRLDVFEAYRDHVIAHQQSHPIQLYTVEVPDVELCCENNVVTACVGDLHLTDLFRYGDQSGSFHDDGTTLHLPGKTVVIAEGYGANYYHFLFNSLVRLAVVVHAHPQMAFDHIVVSDDRPEFVQEAMRILGIPQEKIVSLARTPSVRCERAWFGQYLSELIFPHSLAVQLLQRFFPAQAEGKRRLMIVRKGTRSVTNLGEVTSVLQPFGFEAISCETMTFSQQMQLFASAEAVIAPHGAGLSNSVFCPRGTQIIELMSPRFVETIYWFLSASCGHDHSVLIGNGPYAPLENKFETGGWRSECNANIEVNPGALRQLCIAAGL